MTPAGAIAAAFTGLGMLAPLHASAQTASDRWTFSVMPYVWLPSVDGELKYGPPRAGGSSANVSVDAATLLDNLDLALMVSGEARKGRWLIGTDVIYLDFSKADSAVRSVDFNPGPGPINISTTALNAGTESKLTGWVWTLVGGYAAIQQPRASLDLIGGFRYLSLDTRSDWRLSADVTGPAGAATFARSGSVERSEDVGAAIVGVKGRAKLGAGNWFVNYYADVGGGSSTTTWQGIAGLGYAFKWGDVVLDYRYLHYSQSDGKLIDNLSFGGFSLAARFSF